jgi:calmodulin
LYEIGSVFRSLGLFPTENELNEMLKEIDIDGDGNFTFDEFVQLMFNMGNLSERSEEQEEMELRQAFRVFDKAGNGYITSSDLRSVLQCLGEQLTEDEIEDMINEVDIDGDGRIDYDEFVASLKAERESSCITINEED